MVTTAPVSGFQGFVILWSGQFISLVGSNLAGFALGIYVYWLTGSATAFGGVLALSLLPAVLASPFAGSLVDRWGTRRSLVIANVGNVVVTGVLALLLATGAFAVWHVYLIVSATSVLAALEIPAFAALVPQLVPPRHLGRANGMRMLAMGASEVLAPVLGGVLLLTVGIAGLVWLNLASFLVALLSLALVGVPRPASREPAGRGAPALLAEFAEGWRYVAARRGLLALLLFLAAINFSAGFLDLLIVPLVLAFASSDSLGTVLSVGGVGMILGSVAVSVWGGPRRRVRGILLFSAVLAVATIAGGLRPHLVLVAAAAFAFMAALAVVISANNAVWQTKVEPHLMGRVMAMLNMVGSFPQLVAYLVAGLVLDRVVVPLVGRDAVRSPVLAPLIGSGPGRGAALLMLVMGLLIGLTVLVGALSPSLRRLERELPDMDRVDEEDATAPVPSAAVASPR
jgi:MFS transporter, DHA3 family, macrolide efflux protein